MSMNKLFPLIVLKKEVLRVSTRGEYWFVFLCTVAPAYDFKNVKKCK
jgi:predicted cupin superfamily sugar epimerase